MIVHNLKNQGSAFNPSTRAEEGGQRLEFRDCRLFLNFPIHVTENHDANPGTQEIIQWKRPTQSPRMTQIQTLCSLYYFCTHGLEFVTSDH